MTALPPVTGHESPEAYLNLGVALAAVGDLAAAAESYRRALDLQPLNGAAWGNLGNALSGLGQHDAALEALEAATRLQPGSAVVQFNHGRALFAAGRLAEGLATLLRAVNADPGFAPAWVEASIRLHGLGESEAARQTGDLGVQAAPGWPEAQIALGNALHDLGRFDAAIACYRRALTIDPAQKAALANLGRSLEASGDLPAALQAAEAALALDPDLAQAQLGRATALLAAGDYARGWPAYAARWRQSGSSPPCFPVPVWRGGPASGRTILLYAEQGLGDTLQCVRFAPRVALGGAQVVLQVPPTLVRLLSTLPGLAAVIGGDEHLPAFDLHCPLMDLPTIFLHSLADLAPAAPYLRADPALVAARRLPPARGALRVGLVWAGDARPGIAHARVMDRRRSVPLSAFAPLAALSTDGAVQLFSLQVGPAATQLAALPLGLRITDAVANVADFADTAAMVAQLDLVISVDTSAAHLAAALGRPVWLLSRFDACWRWMRGRADSPWYPSLRLYRQPAPNDWGPVMNAVARDLAGAVRLGISPASVDQETQ